MKAYGSINHGNIDKDLQRLTTAPNKKSGGKIAIRIASVACAAALIIFCGVALWKKLAVSPNGASLGESVNMEIVWEASPTDGEDKVFISGSSGIDFWDFDDYLAVRESVMYNKLMAKTPVPRLSCKKIVYSKYLDKNESLVGWNISIRPQDERIESINADFFFSNNIPKNFKQDCDGFVLVKWWEFDAYCHAQKLEDGSQEVLICYEFHETTAYVRVVCDGTISESDLIKIIFS
jgi:hypothetical protein